MAKRKPYFDEVDTKVDFPKLEKKLLQKWYKKGLPAARQGIVEKYLQKNKSSKKYFSFLDGPITANNPMGVHHAWGRTYKDLYQRFKNMQGFKQRFQNGFDCQGLWVEVEVEKELGLKSKREIENLVPGDRKKSIAKFVELCKKRVYKYAAVQTEQSKRLGYIVDWDHSYFTLSDDNNYMIWHFLKTCHENGWLYKGNESVPWCPRCETAISQHEILTEDYKEATHKSIILEFPLEGRDKEFLLVWTTTPWTIPANIAIAVDKNLDYSLVVGNTGDKFWLASETIERVFGKGEKKVVKKAKGKDLVGLKYRGPFDNLPAVKKVADKNPNTFHTVVATDDRLMPISVDEGTGMIHTAVSAGTEDFRLGQKLGLPMIPVIADNAQYLSELGFLSGKNAKDNPEIILDYLSAEDKKPQVDWVFDIFDYKHRYPCCWRCKEELVWKVTDEWYIAMDRPSRKATDDKSSKTLRQRMIEVAKKIDWIPSFGLERELDWLNNMNDWLISKKNRYWGLALPIWECEGCHHFEIIGSKQELKEKAVKGWEQFERKSPHKPQIDEIKIKCSQCSREISRIEPVGNPWLDAGIVTFSTISKDNLSANKDNIVGAAPLYLTNKKEWEKWAPADFITESFPGQFKNWFYSLIAMSTVLENCKPTKVIFGFATLFAEDGRPMHKSWGNAIEFNEGAEKIGVDVMRWMYIRQNPADNLLFGYKLADETRRRFHLKLWNVYNFFVTYANLDGWKPKNQSSVISYQLSVLDKWILARFEETIKQTTNYLEKYDAFNASISIEEFVEDLSNWYIRRSRSRVGVAVDLKQEKDFFYETCYYLLVILSKLLAPFLPFVSDVIYENLTKEESVHLKDWPIKDSRIRIQKSKILAEMKLVRDIVELGHAERKKGNIPVRQPLSSIKVMSPSKKLASELLQLIEDELNVKIVQWQKGRDLKVKLDTKITPDLRQEAKARELIRKIQDERKRLNFGLSEKAVVVNEWWPRDRELLERVKRVTLTEKLLKGKFKVEKSS